MVIDVGLLARCREFDEVPISGDAHIVASGRDGGSPGLSHVMLKLVVLRDLGQSSFSVSAQLGEQATTRAVLLLSLLAVLSVGRHGCRDGSWSV